MWDWLPGVVAGFIPLFVFILVHVSVVLPTDAAQGESARILGGLTEHLLVFCIVSSCVSTFTSFPRLFFYRESETPLGLGALGLMMLTTLILVFSVAIYALHEALDTRSVALGGGIVLALVTLWSTLYMELAIANVRLRRGETSTV